ncbi:hypothetical protein CHH28_01875 [Bacterioplanes sanyensis]|uniref:Glycosyl transferase family 1 domain-containing protein n=2 Tax=Bacterioplanes sanyensis TaxID=1249553 RepID=A0A222FEH9_9GAMM|nr:hypothetical protein CHH28_01875 [Bacterioplanes sanyensis]
MSWIDRCPAVRARLRDWAENRAVPQPQEPGQWPDWHLRFEQQAPLPDDAELRQFWCGGYRAVISGETISPNWPRRQLLVDVSDLVRFDLHTGIQRVVRNILLEWLRAPNTCWHVEPVFERQGQYYYARRFAWQLLGAVPSQSLQAELTDHLVAVKSGDAFVGLDWAMPMLQRAEPLLQHWRRQGVATCFVVYDLLPMTLPQYYPAQFAQEMSDWLIRLARIGDEVCCISATVAAELQQFYQRQQQVSPRLSHFYLGSDLAALEPCPVAGIELEKGIPVVLMVGTIDPRKGYWAALDALEALWRNNVQCTLVVVGRVGSRVDAIISRMNRLQQQSSAGQRFIWQANCSDSGLEWWYQQADWLLAASEGEGFGLPVLEADRRGVPVLARDIPVFREVAPPTTEFFTDDDNLAPAIERCLHHQAAAHGKRAIPPHSPPPAQVSWQQSAEQLMQKLR